ncbi:distal tail protein Dit [Salinicoccus roseus]|uniref:distal tail protein Dit n=1 Tax=Salinicoccus roseus TaxID=45670 RepID=UPI002301F4DF|nr:distal tail protein Dit [Salinicoccus roseus]
MTFIQPTETSTLRASSVQTIIDGVNLDETYTTDKNEIRTLKVFGRDSTEYNVRNIDVPGRDGSLNQGKFLKSRPLKIRVKIKSDSHTNFLKLMEAINSHFDSRKAQAIQFSDENLIYYGAYIAKSETSGYKKSEIIDFEFICHDPYKYTEEQSMLYSNATTINVNSRYPVKPYLQVIFTEVTNEFSIRNTSKDLSIFYEREDAFNTQVYHFEIDNNRIHRSTNETDGIAGLVLMSDWEDFVIEDGDQLVVTPTPESITVIYRGVYL